MWFFQNPEIIFYHFFRIFNVDIFWALILQKCIGSKYLVPSTPPTVFGQSFWNFTEAFRMVLRYACGVFIILKVFLITFSAFLALLYVELISQGESPASVREYVSTSINIFLLSHLLPSKFHVKHILNLNASCPFWPHFMCCIICQMSCIKILFLSSVIFFSPFL